MIEKLLTVYWGQVTLILVAFAYFIKRIYDNKSKKIEINHTLFQQNRLKVVNDFFVNYAKAELMWEQLAIYDILSNKLEAKSIDNIIWPILNELKKNQLELQIYFNGSEMSYFHYLVSGIFSINRRLSELFFNYDENKTLGNKADDFFAFRLDINNKNDRIIKDLCMIIKNSYKA